MEPPKPSLNANLARISFRDAIAKLPPGSSLLLRFAPDVAAHFGICASEAELLARQERELEGGVTAETEPDVDEGSNLRLPEEAAE
jgi:hypothetical protein